MPEQRGENAWHAVVFNRMESRRVFGVKAGERCGNRSARQIDCVLCVFDEGEIVAIRREAKANLVAHLRQGIIPELGFQQKLIGADAACGENHPIGGDRILLGLRRMVIVVLAVADLITATRKWLDSSDLAQRA